MSNKVPQIRFNGYSDPWEERKLGDISKVIDPHPSHRAPVAIEKGIPFIGIGDVDEIGNINYKTARIVHENIFDEHHKRYDLAIPSIGIGRVASLGKVIRLRSDIGKYAVSPTMSVIQFSDTNDLEFLHANMNTPLFQNQFKSFSNGSTRQSVGIQDLRTLLLELPTNLDEQRKIGLFFNQLDNTIALHQRKLDLLKEQKKGYLQKMFPKNGAKVPELRFAGFADDWEERKLGEIFDTITDYVANGSFESLRKNVNSSDINGFAYLVRLQDASNNWKGPWLYTDQHGYEFLKKSRLQPDDIIMANVGSVGKFFLVPNLDKPMTLAPNAVLIKSSENDQGFLYQMMLTPEMQYKIFEKTTPGAQSKINKTDFKMIETRLPNIEEQKKIGSFFKQLDDTIALHQRKLDLLKEQKKGFLQKMFV